MANMSKSFGKRQRSRSVRNCCFTENIPKPISLALDIQFSHERSFIDAHWPFVIAFVPFHHHDHCPRGKQLYCTRLLCRWTPMVDPMRSTAQMTTPY